MQAYSKERCEEFSKTLPDDLKLNTAFTYDRDRRSPAPEINAEAHKIKADLIIIGARGRNRLTALFLGSVTEKLIRSDNDIPLLVIKSTENKFGLADVLNYL
jgi:nucleotide-binding universal stress UspA family protein